MACGVWWGRTEVKVPLSDPSAQCGSRYPLPAAHPPLQHRVSETELVSPRKSCLPSSLHQWHHHPYSFPDNRVSLSQSLLWVLTPHLQLCHSTHKPMNQQSSLILPHKCLSNPDPPHHAPACSLPRPLWVNHPQQPLTHTLSEGWPSSFLTLPSELSFIKTHLIVWLLNMSVSSPLLLGITCRDVQHLTATSLICFTFCKLSTLYIHGAQTRTEMKVHIHMHEHKNI